MIVRNSETPTCFSTCFIFLDSGDPARSAYMSISAYRIRNAITAVIRRGASERFKSLEGGSILFPISGPNAAGMIEARYENDFVLVFERDLDNATEEIKVEVAGAS
jgi:hypothetical protein